MNEQNQGVKLEEKTKELFLHAKQVASKGALVICGNHYKGTLQGVTYSVDLQMHMGSDSISVSTDSWGVYLSNHFVFSSRNREYHADTWKGEVPENLNEILIALKFMPNEEIKFRPNEEKD